jgi:hypothetical protein
MSNEMPTTPGRIASSAHSLRIVTSYASVADFIHGFCRSIDEAHMLIGLTRRHPVGTRLHFVICLVDGTAIFDGSGTIVELVPSRRRAGVMGARLALDEVRAESRTMQRCLLMARQALVLARAADSAGFEGDIPEYARVLPNPFDPLPQLARGTQPSAPTLPSVGDERISTATATQVAGVIHCHPAPVLTSVGDDTESEATRLLAVPVAAVSGQDGASSSAIPALFGPHDTERVSLLEESALAPPPRRWRTAMAFLLVSAALALAAGSALGYL